MSALGQKQTFAVQNGMSALPPKADKPVRLDKRNQDFLKEKTSAAQGLLCAQGACIWLEKTEWSTPCRFTKTAAASQL